MTITKPSIHKFDCLFTDKIAGFFKTKLNSIYFQKGRKV